MPRRVVLSLTRPQAEQVNRALGETLSGELDDDQSKLLLERAQSALIDALREGKAESEADE